MSTVKFIPNIDLAQNYRTIRLKPRKYEDKGLKYSNRDSILPYFQINFNNYERSYKQFDDYNKNNISIKE